MTERLIGAASLLDQRGGQPMRVLFAFGCNGVGFQR